MDNDKRPTFSLGCQCCGDYKRYEYEGIVKLAVYTDGDLTDYWKLYCNRCDRLTFIEVNGCQL